jgi:alpha-ribazole phosphatase
MSGCFYLVRHGVTRWNQEQRYVGFLDVPLSPEGKMQARQCAQALARFPVTAIYASDRRRALQSAAFLAELSGLSVCVSPLLRELHFGEWEGLAFEEVRQRDPERLQRWLRDPYCVAPPGGETLKNLFCRVKRFVGEVAGQEGTTVIFSHSGFIRTALCLAEGIQGYNRQRFWNRTIDPGVFVAWNPKVPLDEATGGV